jgi:hypothetical protein
VNEKGHAKTLVASQPGNTNAVKAGVYSARILEPRVRDLADEFEALPVAELRAQLLRLELAGLSVLAEAADQTLAKGGLVGRDEKPRTVAQLRLRVHDKLLSTLSAYEAAVCPPPDEPGHAQQAEIALNVRPFGKLLAAVAQAHGLASFDDLTPQAFNPDAFLEAVIVSRDQGVTSDNRFKARKTLTLRKRSRGRRCLCFPTRKARDELEFREWMDEAREAGLSPHPEDPELAGRVRRLAAGHSLVPWVSYQRQDAAVRTSIEAEMRRISGKGEAGDERKTGEHVPTIAPFWQMLLNPDMAQHTVSDRLRALEALEDVGAFPSCRCEASTAYLAEEHTDEAWAYVIRLVPMSHWRAAMHRAQFPETYLAIRDIADERIFGDPLYSSRRLSVG